MGKRRRYDTYAFQPATVVRPTTTPKPATFSPPIAMQQSVWDSIVNGNFVDAKVFAFSRLSREPGRVNTPKALFINTHVLATACSYFRSTFDSSDGIVTSLKARPPPGVENVFDLGEHDIDGDYDVPVEDTTRDPVETVPPTDEATPILPERTVKAYVVKYTAYKTLRAIIWYIYSGEIAFSPSYSPDTPSASAKSVYLFADEHRMGDLKKLAFDGIATHVNSLPLPKLVEETLSVFTSRHPELHGLYINRLQLQLLSPFETGDPFQQQLSRYFSGELPHGREILTSLLQALMNGSAIDDPRCELGGSCDIIARVSHPWPARTKKMLRMSLDKGAFEDIHITTLPGSGSTKHPVHFAGAVDEAVGSSISRLCRSELPHQYDAETYLLTWQAIAYYMYTGGISFKPLAPKRAELAPAHNPSETLFRGPLCSPREVLYLARKLTTCDALVDLAATEIASFMTPENVIEEMFCDPPPPARVISRGVEIIRANRANGDIFSKLRKVLGDAASGGSSANFAAFLACFSGLYR